MGDTMKFVLSWMGILGIPSVFVMCGWCVRRCVWFTIAMRTLQAAQKAQMRSQLIHQYYQYKAQPKVASDDIDDWINQYDAYHLLYGNNGVLDARKADLLTFPTYQR